MDVLSEILKAFTLKGAVFYNAEYSAPWSFRSPASKVIAPHLAQGADVHVIVYHLVTEGSAWAQVEAGPRAELGPGDVVIFPHGDPHLMGNGRPVEIVDHGLELQRILSHGLETERRGGGGELTKFTCGYMACDLQLSRFLLSGFPALFKVNIRNDASGVWLQNSIQFSVAHAGSSSAGAEAVLAKLSEALFIETLRRYIAQLPPGDTGWLAGARDPDVGRTLALMHREPAQAWTIAGLSESVGVSRAVLAERFRQFLGEPPIAYLTRWRMQLGRRLLTGTNQSVAEVAARVGYDSEAAFNRAFKRQFGAPPARFRRASKTTAAGKDG